jgi:hypothetical protein
MDLDAIEHWTLLDGVDGVAERLGAYVDSGVQEFALMVLGGDPLGQYERLAEVRARLLAGIPRAVAVSEGGE